MPSDEMILNKPMATLHARFAGEIERITAASRLSDIGIDSLHLLDIGNEFSFRFELAVAVSWCCKTLAGMRANS